MASEGCTGPLTEHSVRSRKRTLSLGYIFVCLLQLQEVMKIQTA
jgi:hypothetical protein